MTREVRRWLIGIVVVCIVAGVLAHNANAAYQPPAGGQPLTADELQQERNADGPGWMRGD